MKKKEILYTNADMYQRLFAKIFKKKKKKEKLVHPSIPDANAFEQQKECKIKQHKCLRSIQTATDEWSEFGGLGWNWKAFHNKYQAYFGLNKNDVLDGQEGHLFLSADGIKNAQEWSPSRRVHFFNHVKQ